LYKQPSPNASRPLAAEEFLVNFVVEQTGYPPEVVDLDADLEADLGIDSLKRAQLFGELWRHFSIGPTGHLASGDFPTLRHILRFMQDTTGMLDRFLVNYVTDRIGCLPETVDWDADLEADLGIDPITKAEMLAELLRESAGGEQEPLPADRFVTLRHVRDYFADRPRR
jgi:acyl carrier protein